MSGIFGIFYKDNISCTSHIEPLRQTLQAMQTAMQHWGPDGQGCWQDGPVGLGHLMLHTTPESLYEQLPFCYPCYPHLVITADARLDNRADLFSVLAIPPPQQAAMPDSLLILHAYMRWGDDCPIHLLGAYTFAIWDKQRRHLFCARDHLGFRPFYYCDLPQMFLFAADIKAILAVDGVPRRLDKEAILAAQHMGARELKERTLFHAIAKLLPAHTLTIHAHHRQHRTYWTPGQTPELRLKTTENYVEALRHQVETAITPCLRSAFPIGAHLSGGLDSSSVAVLAARQLRKHGQTLAGVYSWSPTPKPEEYPLQDERALIEAICQQENLTCHYADLTPDDVLATYMRDISAEPSVGLFCETLVQRQTAAQQVRVLLSGWGGDEVVTFNGDGYWPELLWRGQWLKLRQELKQYRQVYGDSLVSLLQNKVLFPLLPDPLYAWLDRRPAWKSRTEFSPQARRLLLRNLRRARTRHSVRTTQLSLLANGHLTERMEAWAAEGAAYALDYRYPLLDRRLIDFSMSLPPDEIFQQGWKRYLFRRALADVLPASVCWNKTKRDPAYTAMLQAQARSGRQAFLEQVVAGHAQRQSASLLSEEVIQRLQTANTSTSAA